MASANLYDVTGDGKATSLDALRVINELARKRLNTESEQIDQVMASMLGNEPDLPAPGPHPPSGEQFR
ncbi:MAG: dockerin type I domain-containing protein [Rubripirellula sp.]